MAFLRAFTDDSLAQARDRRLFLAGYLHNTAAWSAFSEEWQAELRAWPSVEYFKAKEANRLSGQFDRIKGWNETIRNAKVSNLAAIVAHYQPFSYQFSLNRQIFEDELKPVSPYGFGKPHFQLCYAAVAGIARYAAQQGITEPIEFIFDEQEGVDDDVALFFGELIKALPAEAQNVIEGPPSFKSDRSEGNLPLQAADLLVWHLRREHEESASLPLTSSLLNKSGHLIQEIPDEIVRMWAAHHGSQPGTSLLLSRAQWRHAKAEIRRLLAAGIDPAEIDGPGTYYSRDTPALLRLWGTAKRFFARSSVGRRLFKKRGRGERALRP